MVMPTLGAANVFLAIYSSLPTSVQSFILTGLFCIGGSKLLKRIVDI